jgi:hypothetical protein
MIKAVLLAALAALAFASPTSAADRTDGPHQAVAIYLPTVSVYYVIGDSAREARINAIDECREHSEKNAVPVQMSVYSDQCQMGVNVPNDDSWQIAVAICYSDGILRAFSAASEFGQEYERAVATAASTGWLGYHSCTSIAPADWFY